jgi:predicted NodU family carbamoyl transferase
MPGRRGGPQLGHDTRLLKEAGFERIFVQPAASDAGNASGPPLRVWHQQLGPHLLGPPMVDVNGGVEPDTPSDGGRRCTR